MSANTHSVWGDRLSPRVDEPDAPHTVAGDDGATAMGLLKGLLFHLQEHQEALDDILANQAVLGPEDDANITSVASATTSAQLLAANSLRKGVMIYNSDANALSIRYSGAAAAASAGNRSVVIPASGLWEMPFPIYTGAITGIWGADGSGSAEITEW